MKSYASIADNKRIEDEKPLAERLSASSIYDQLSITAKNFPNKDALSFQLKSGANDPAETLSGFVKYLSEILRIFCGKVAENNNV